ncbi:MAG: 23S rRNA (uracil(1939)-C(5))-methyltransferase RlmD [Oscillospiraceae bacterium]|nr:23S rRNA (uracil(1939)-C(5))-methyltransferase RlmD [Oscillospiraceae bacterium]
MALIRKNQDYELTVVSASAEGFGVCRLDGRAIFVPGALEGERWRVHIVKVTETTIWGKGIELLEASPSRIPNDCPNPCGGCCLRHMRYEEELRLKKQRVDDCLHRLGDLDITVSRIHPSPLINGYRNKAVFAVGTRDGKAVVGFYSPRSHRIIPAADCRLQSENCLRAARAVTSFMNLHEIPAYDEDTGRGCVRRVFYRESDTHAVLVIVAARGFGAMTAELTESIRRACPFLSGIVLNINKSRGNVVLDGDFYTLFGSAEITATLLGVHFEISPQAFFQINRLQAENLYSTAIEWASPAQRVLDLYCGAGTISLCFAAQGARVTGVELVPEAVENARRNAALNGIADVDFLCADVSELHFDTPPDVLIVDPPRKGLAPGVVEQICCLGPTRVVYVSCNPATLARDLRLFTDRKYLTERVEAFDMFPRTAHVETVCLLTHKGDKGSKWG